MWLATEQTGSGPAVKPPSACGTQGLEPETAHQARPATSQTHICPQTDSHAGPPAKAANGRKINRQHNQPQRHHPEAQDWQKPQKSATHQNHTQRQPQQRMIGHGHVHAEKPDAFHGWQHMGGDDRYTSGAMADMRKYLKFALKLHFLRKPGPLFCLPHQLRQVPQHTS
jgi:hypothetical protein